MYIAKDIELYGYGIKTHGCWGFEGVTKQYNHLESTAANHIHGNQRLSWDHQPVPYVNRHGTSFLEGE